MVRFGFQNGFHKNTMVPDPVSKKSLNFNDFVALRGQASWPVANQAHRQEASHLASQSGGQASSQAARDLASKPARQRASQAVSQLAGELSSQLRIQPACRPASQPGTQPGYAFSSFVVPVLDHDHHRDHHHRGVAVFGF